MEFFTVDNLKNGTSIISRGIDIALMSKAFKVLDKQSEFKTVDSMVEYSVVFLENHYTIKKEDTVFSYAEKKINFALINEKSIFEIQDGDKNIYFCAIHEGTLKAYQDKANLEKELSKKSLIAQDSITAKAIDWLDNGRVGLSSATMCATLFPQLKEHHKLKDNYDEDGKLEINWPHDNSDFGRCLKFLEAVPEAKARLGELKPLSKEWSNLVDKWEAIETLIKEGKTEESYLMIKDCLGKKKALKP